MNLYLAGHLIRAHAGPRFDGIPAARKWIIRADSARQRPDNDDPITDQEKEKEMK
jgi:hypothetical protein